MGDQRTLRAKSAEDMVLKKVREQPRNVRPPPMPRIPRTESELQPVLLKKRSRTATGTGTQPEVPNHTNIVNNSENAKKRPPEQTERAFSKARYLDYVTRHTVPRNRRDVDLRQVPNSKTKPHVAPQLKTILLEINLQSAYS